MPITGNDGWGMTRKRGRQPNHGTDAQDPRKTAKTTSAGAPTHTDNKPAEPHMPTTDVTQDADVRGQRETQTETAHIGTRVVSLDIPRQVSRGQGRPRTHNRAMNSQSMRARKQSQYKWSAVGRDAFDVAQQTTQLNTDDNRTSDQRFERGEGGGVT